MTQLISTILRPVDGGGNPYPGGTLEFYDAGASTTPKTVYADRLLATSLGDTVTADGEGLFVGIYFSGDIRYVLKDSSGIIKNTEDIYGAGNIDTGDIADDAVTTVKIADGAVTVGKIFTLSSGYIITSNGVANSEVPPSGVVAMSATGVFSFVAGSVNAAALATNAVETVKILDANVTLAKLASDVTGTLDNVPALISTTAITATTNIDITLDTSTYSDFEVKIIGAIPNAGDEFRPQFLHTGGTVAYNGASDYNVGYQGQSLGNADLADDGMWMTGIDLVATTTATMSGTIRLPDLSSTTSPYVWFSEFFYTRNGGTTPTAMRSQGVLNKDQTDTGTNPQPDAIRLRWHTADFEATGSIELYGIKI